MENALKKSPDEEEDEEDLAEEDILTCEIRGTVASIVANMEKMK